MWGKGRIQNCFYDLVNGANSLGDNYEEAPAPDALLLPLVRSLSLYVSELQKHIFLHSEKKKEYAIFFSKNMRFMSHKDTR